MLAPVFDQRPGLFHRAENLPVEQLVSELTVEAFIVSILPRTSWFDKECLQPNPLKPFSQGHGDKLWTIVRPDMSWHAMLPLCVRNGLQDIA